jgi:hypothetical protein
MLGTLRRRHYLHKWHESPSYQSCIAVVLAATILVMKLSRRLAQPHANIDRETAVAVAGDRQEGTDETDN